MTTERQKHFLIAALATSFLAVVPAKAQTPSDPLGTGGRDTSLPDMPLFGEKAFMSREEFNRLATPMLDRIEQGHRADFPDVSDEEIVLVRKNAYDSLEKALSKYRVIGPQQVAPVPSL
ncbi:MAG: hypothetical protein LRY39_02070 [Alphaproteobacteria bacterium]|nr:hypothetical protein [Alphaproteobacteria bacterium]MCD8571498.1 hypothetical protein [Alphaproteobacteria bacterium]